MIWRLDSVIGARVALPWMAAAADAAQPPPTAAPISSADTARAHLLVETNPAPTLLDIGKHP